MPRRRSSSPRPRSSPSGRGFSTSSSSRAAPPPAARPHAPPPAPQQSGLGGGLMGTVMQGMAFGGGSAMAHRAVDAVLGSRHATPVEAQQAAQTIVEENMPCGDQAKAFSDCMSLSNGDMEACRVFFERMQECRLALS